jgi:ABC-type Zn uptake system ZnuABC Zn-binding protein ZnuA
MWRMPAAEPEKNRIGRKMKNHHLIGLILLFSVLLSACQSAVPPTSEASAETIQVLATNGVLADITQNVAGDRLKVKTLIPQGLDPHAFEPTPRDIAAVADSQVLVVNGAGLEEWLQDVLDNAGGERLVIEASQGLLSRAISEEEKVLLDAHEAAEGDPHFWLDPTLAMRYVENIRDGLAQADPAGAEVYAQNAQTYIDKLDELDAWAKQTLAVVPAERRLLVTNHESFGYFADRYGFQVVGAIIPNTSSSAAPSAQQMAHLVDQIRRMQVPAIFLETGANPELARQLADEAGVKSVVELYTHSLTAPDGPAATYLDLMRTNVIAIVEALK